MQMNVELRGSLKRRPNLKEKLLKIELTIVGVEAKSGTRAKFIEKNDLHG